MEKIKNHLSLNIWQHRQGDRHHVYVDINYEHRHEHRHTVYVNGFAMNNKDKH